MKERKMSQPPVIGVMGGGNVDPKTTEAAYELGKAIAENGWILLNGGRNAGAMDASARGAYEVGGITVGILPDDNDRQTSKYIQIPILTGMGSGRNNLNVLSSRVVVACPGGAGTISEIALALKKKRPVILLGFDIGEIFDNYKKTGLLFQVETPEDAVERVKEILSSSNGE